MPLKGVIEKNGWSLDLFAVEVRAIVCCSRSVLCCFISWGLRNCTIDNTAKQASKCSRECSFCIWLVRNNRAWSSKETDLPLNTPDDPLVHLNPPSTISETNCIRSNSPLPVGFLNKGNTCYANNILQALSVLPLLGKRVPSESSSSPIFKSITLNMRAKSRSNKSVDPSNFYGPSLVRSQSLVMHHLILTFNKMLLSATVYHRWTEGSFSTRVLQPRLDLISNINRINVSCNQCFCFSPKEETLDMIAIPLSANISSSWSKFLKSEVLESKDKWFCPSCNCLTESSKETSIISLHSA